MGNSPSVVLSSATGAGVSKVTDGFVRFADQMSTLPFPPLRLDPKKTVRPSRETTGLLSDVLELSSVTGAGAEYPPPSTAGAR